MVMIGAMMFLVQGTRHVLREGRTDQGVPLAANREKRLLEDFKKGAPVTTKFTASKEKKDDNDPTDNSWESSSILPPWMKDYFAFHQQQRRQLVEEWQPLFSAMEVSDANRLLWNQPDTPSEEQYRFLIVRCFTFDRKCGGLADRLLPLPYLIQLAHNTSRLLLIHFQKPAPLEEYLVPPRGGMDWRIPAWLVPVFNFTGESRRYKADQFLENHARSRHTNDTVVQSIFQAWHYGSFPYDQRRLSTEEPSFDLVHRDIWRSMFTPVLPIQKLIRHELNTLGLVEGNYAAVHCRVLYAVSDRPVDEIQLWTQNALQCAFSIYNDHRKGPYFVASDSIHATQMAVAHGRTLSWHPQIVARITHKTPQHFDRIPVVGNGNWLGRPYVPSEYYDTYIDLMLLAMVRATILFWTR